MDKQFYKKTFDHLQVEDTVTEELMRKLESDGKAVIRRRRISRRVLLPVAATAVILSATAAVYAVSIQDSLRNAFTEQAPTGEATKATSNLGLLAESAEVVGQSIQTGSLSISFDLILGDSSSAYILVDVTSKSGLPVFPCPENETADLKHQTFEQGTYQIEGEESAGNLFFERTDDGSEPDHATYKGQVSSRFGLIGRKLKLTVGDLKNVTLSAEDISMKQDNLLQLYQSFEPAVEDDFVQGEALPDHADSGEPLAYRYTMRDSGRSIPLCDRYSGLVATNMGFHTGMEYRENCLYLNLAAASPEQAQELADLAFYNTQTHEYIPLHSAASDPNRQLQIDGTRVSVVCPQINSEEELAQYQIVSRYKRTETPMGTGKHTLELTCSYQSSEKTFRPGLTIQGEAGSRRVSWLKVSPFTLEIEAFETGRFEIGKLSTSAVILLQDGSELDAGGKLSGGGPDPTQGNRITLSYTLPSVIDPEQVVGIRIWGETLQLQ